MQAVDDYINDIKWLLSFLKGKMELVTFLNQYPELSEPYIVIEPDIPYDEDLKCKPKLSGTLYLIYPDSAIREDSEELESIDLYRKSITLIRWLQSSRYKFKISNTLVRRDEDLQSWRAEIIFNEV